MSATNRDLSKEVTKGRFRLDLLYRLDVVRITLPPLRDRREDVALLVDRYWREAADRVGSRAILGAATLAALARYDWPGNVRELQNVLAALAVRCSRRGCRGTGRVAARVRDAAACVGVQARRSAAQRLKSASFGRHSCGRAVIGPHGHRARGHAPGVDQADGSPWHRGIARGNLTCFVSSFGGWRSPFPS